MTIELKFDEQFAYVDPNPFYENKTENIIYQYVWQTKQDGVDSLLIRMDITKYTKEERTKMTQILSEMKLYENCLSWFLPIKKFVFGKFNKRDELWIVCENCQTINMNDYLQIDLINEEEQRYIINQYVKMMKVIIEKKWTIHFDMKDIVMISNANDFRPTFKIPVTLFLINLKKKTPISQLYDGLGILMQFFVLMNKKYDEEHKEEIENGKESRVKTNTEYIKISQMLKQKKPIREIEKNQLLQQAQKENSFRSFDMKQIEPIGIIGFGAYGTIIKVKYQGKIYCLKESDKEKLTEIEKEAIVLHLCDHEKIMKCHGIATSWHSISLQLQKKRQKRRKFIYLLLDFYGNGNFDAYLDEFTKKKQRMNKDQIAHLFREMLIPVYYLQQKKQYLHSDIKPENYMVLYHSEEDKTSGKCPDLVLTDFGNCRTFSNESKFVRGTSKNWDSNRRAPLTVNHDIYPLGVCLYRMLTNKMPLGDNEEQVQQKITENDSVKFPKWILKKEELLPFVELARKILCFDEEKRMTFEELWKDELVIELLK